MVKKEKDASTEQRILDAAKQVFVSKGMAGARMQDIADGAGINKAMLHYYFRSKEQLFEIIFRDSIGRFVPKVKALITSELSLYEKIEQFCDGYISMALENPYIPMFVLNELHKQPDAFVRKMFNNELPDLSKLVQQIDEEIKKGNIKPISPVQLIMNMMSLCVFPFLAKPIFSILMGLDELQFRNSIEQRKKAVPQFIMDSIKR